MTIIEVDGKWNVVEGNHLLHVAETNAEAWAWADRRHDGARVSRSRAMTPEQIIRDMQERQQQLLKHTKGRKRARARHGYRIGKLGGASPVRHLVRDGKPVEQTP
jgi:hypothetical protein